MEAFCKAMEEAYDLCDLKEYVWDKKVGTASFKRRLKRFLGHYSWLAKNSMKSAECMWILVQKHHLLAHYTDSANTWHQGAAGHMEEKASCP